MHDTNAAHDDPAARLGALRAELDRIDDSLHALLMARAKVVEGVAALGTHGKVALRPGREADIIRRLLRNHHGALPRQVLPRMWREMLAGTTGMQRSYVITVCETDPGNAFVQCAREHFGALTALRVHRSPAQAIGEVSAGRAIAAVLPMPTEDEGPSLAWWTALLHRDEPRIHIVARLPFWAPRPDGAPLVQALVVATAAPDASEDDRSFLGLEIALDTSRARLSGLIIAAGFSPGTIILRRDQAAGVAQALVDVAGMVGDCDPRLAAIVDLLRPPVVLGGYATPLDGDKT
jgi:chorismate mutase/prephenate dehydratase